MAKKTKKIPVEEIDKIDEVLAAFTDAYLKILADRLVPCACGALVGEPCRGLPSDVNHFGRRLRRILQEGTLPSEDGG